jgi:hypothetical protein
MKTPKFLLPAAAAGILALTLSACGGGTTGGGGGGDAEQGLDGRGPITYVQGKDNSNVVRPLIEKWNAAHPNEKVTFKEQTDQADQQHDDLVQNFQAKNVNYDVVDVDVVWTAEFAAKGWLQPLKDKMALDTSAMLKPTVDIGDVVVHVLGLEVLDQVIVLLVGLVGLLLERDLLVRVGSIPLLNERTDNVAVVLALHVRDGSAAVKVGCGVTAATAAGCAASAAAGREG